MSRSCCTEWRRKRSASVLELMGWEPHRARTLALRFRRHSVQQLRDMAPHFRDESKLVSLARAGRAQLEQLFAQERLEHPPLARTWDADTEPGDESFDDAEAAQATPADAAEGTKH